jgi:hypothetical protein
MAEGVQRALAAGMSKASCSPLFESSTTTARYVRRLDNLGSLDPRGR